MARKSDTDLEDEEKIGALASRVVAMLTRLIR
jgi:hypothetical protein